MVETKSRRGSRRAQEGAFLVGLGLRSREACVQVLEERGIRVLSYEGPEEAEEDLAWMSPSLLFVPARDEAKWIDILLDRSDGGWGPVDVLPDLVCLSSVPEYLWKGGGCEPLRDLLGDPDWAAERKPVAARLLEPVMAHELIPVLDILQESRRLRRQRLARQRLEEPYLGPLRILAARSRFAVLVNAARLVEHLTGVSQVVFLRKNGQSLFVEHVFGVPRRRLQRVVDALEVFPWRQLPENTWVESRSEVGRAGGQGIRWVYQLPVSGPSGMALVLFARKAPHWSERADADMRLVAEHVRLGLASAGDQSDEDRRRDPWTGLPGLAHFVGMVQGLFAQGLRRVRILFVDVEGFSDVNRRFGHLAGAFLVTQVASRLVRAGADVVGRVGPDSFLMAVAGRSSEPPERLESFVESSLSFDLRIVPGLVVGLGGQAPSGGWNLPVSLQIRSVVVHAGEEVETAVKELTEFSAR